MSSNDAKKQLQDAIARRDKSPEAEARLEQTVVPGFGAAANEINQMDPSAHADVPLILTLPNW
jgi:hypothetical protein